MESQSYSSSSTSSSTNTYLSPYPPEDKKPNLPPPAFHSALHSVRKLPAKPWKKPIAPLPATPARIYKVESVDFKQLVQKLTGANSRRLQRVAPPPLSLSTSTAATSDSDEAAAATLELLPSSDTTTPLSATYHDLMAEAALDAKPWKLSDSFAAVSNSLGLFSFSPSSSHGWCSFPLLSPGTLSSLQQSI